MKKILSLFLAAALTFSSAACRTAESPAADAGETVTQTPSVTDTAPENVTDSSPDGLSRETADVSHHDTPDTADPSQDGSSVLVAYFSWADNAVPDESTDAVTSPSVFSPGNVEQLAGWVREATGGDLFSIQVTDPYPGSWDECLERANEERGENARPQLTSNVENPEQYDTVFLGYPNWWYGVPMALLSFLEQNDLSGKQVYLFCSHGTGGLANSVNLIAEAAPEAVISENIFDCYEEDASSSQEEIQAWVREVMPETETAPANTGAQRISIQSADHTIIYELNDGTAAASLLEQLPLTLETEDYSTNEKIFYPPSPLDTGDSPLAESGAGTLAYYAPWGDVVMFYDSYSPNSSLYELGQATEGEEFIGQLSGTITIDIAE